MKGESPCVPQVHPVFPGAARNAILALQSGIWNAKSGPGGMQPQIHQGMPFPDN